MSECLITFLVNLKSLSHFLKKFQFSFFGFLFIFFSSFSSLSTVSIFFSLFQLYFLLLIIFFAPFSFFSAFFFFCLNMAMDSEPCHRCLFVSTHEFLYLLFSFLFPFYLDFSIFLYPNRFFFLRKGKDRSKEEEGREDKKGEQKGWRS